MPPTRDGDRPRSTPEPQLQLHQREEGPGKKEAFQLSRTSSLHPQQPSSTIGTVPNFNSRPTSGPSSLSWALLHYGSSFAEDQNNPADMAIRRPMTGRYAGPFDPTNRFETSWILPPGVLFGIRALISLYTFTTYFTIFGWNGSHQLSRDSRQSFSYFTDLTYWGLAFYFAFSALHTGSYWLTGTPLLAHWPKTLQIAHSMFYATIVIYPWVVTGKSKLLRFMTMGICVMREGSGLLMTPTNFANTGLS